MRLPAPAAPGGRPSLWRVPERSCTPPWPPAPLPRCGPSIWMPRGRRPVSRRPLRSSPWGRAGELLQPLFLYWSVLCPAPGLVQGVVGPGSAPSLQGRRPTAPPCGRSERVASVPCGARHASNAPLSATRSTPHAQARAGARQPGPAAAAAGAPASAGTARLLAGRRCSCGAAAGSHSYRPALLARRRRNRRLRAGAADRRAAAGAAAGLCLHRGRPGGALSCRQLHNSKRGAGQNTRIAAAGRLGSCCRLGSWACMLMMIILPECCRAAAAAFQND